MTMQKMVIILYSVNIWRWKVLMNRTIKHSDEQNCDKIASIVFKRMYAKCEIFSGKILTICNVDCQFSSIELLVQVLLTHNFADYKF